VPRALEKLEHKDAHPVAYCTECGAECGGGFTFAGPGVDEDKAGTVRCRFWVHRPSIGTKTDRSGESRRREEPTPGGGRPLLSGRSGRDDR
jgi:hypothetical protein